jgi:hypothetical protein
VQEEALNQLKTLKMSPELKSYLPLMELYEQQLVDPEPNLKILAPALKNLIDEAARSRLDSLHHHVQEIKKQVSADQWSRLSVLVMGPPMPREGELSMQYFHATLSAEEKCPYLKKALTDTEHVFEQKRLIYAESIDQEEKALDLLTTHISDERLGLDLLGDEKVMRGDLLREAAHKHLRSLGLIETQKKELL